MRWRRMSSAEPALSWNSATLAWSCPALGLERDPDFWMVTLPTVEDDMVYVGPESGRPEAVIEPEVIEVPSMRCWLPPLVSTSAKSAATHRVFISPAASER